MWLYILFALGFPALLKGADLLVDGSVSIAKKFNISNIVIGLTIVAFGTSMPELVVNIMAGLNGNNEIAIGNVLGSNIANIFLILGVAALIYPLSTKQNTVWKEIPFSLLAILVLGTLVNDQFIDGGPISILSRIDGFILLAFFIIFFYYIIGISKGDKSAAEADLKEMATWKSFLYIALGLVGLMFGGKWVVDGAVAIATALNISQSLIGLTIVAVGTSLPELATSAVAAYKKQTDIAIGNVVGSNIFNIFWILGLGSIINPIIFTPKSNIDI
ncbi:MAG TPA: calcium/sodium antiporter, partial [bacterium]|nr:calcium/sodium antiporter [bacterium]